MKPMNEFLKLLVGVFLGFLISVFLSWKFPMTAFARDAAVKAGHAEYFLDANSNRQWRWKGQDK